MYLVLLPWDLWEPSLTIQIKLTLMMVTGSLSRIGHNVLSNVVEELKLFKDNVFHQKLKTENHVMEMLS
jgi:hypothetical protein